MIVFQIRWFNSSPPVYNNSLPPKKVLWMGNSKYLIDLWPRWLTAPVEILTLHLASMDDPQSTTRPIIAPQQKTKPSRHIAGRHTVNQVYHVAATTIKSDPRTAPADIPTYYIATSTADTGTLWNRRTNLNRETLAPSSDINQLWPGQYTLSARLLIKKNLLWYHLWETHTRTHMLTASLLFHLIGKRYSCTRMLSAGLAESCCVIFFI